MRPFYAGFPVQDIRHVGIEGSPSSFRFPFYPFQEIFRKAESSLYIAAFSFYRIHLYNIFRKYITLFLYLQEETKRG